MRAAAAACLLVVMGCWPQGTEVLAQSMYKYRGPDGEWIYTDRAPEASETVEVRDLQKGGAEPQVRVVDRQY
jgi:hypothetical protein